MQMLLDGQTFTHAVFGIVCGGILIVCGLALARANFADIGSRWLWRIMAGIGLALALWCTVQLPSAYRFQNKFNERSRKALEETVKPKPAG